MIKIVTGPWHSKQKMASLHKYPYVLHIAPGKTDKQALQNTAKELKRLAKECDERIKELGKSDSSR